MSTIDIRERYNDHQENTRVAEDALQSRIWTVLPGVIVSFTVADGAPVASVKLAVKGYDSANDGSRSFHDLPTLPHCPVVFPRGGGCSLTFPVNTGDECMVLFSSRSIDEWWQSGIGQPPFDYRQHDLSDGLCFVGLTSKARPLANISTAAAQLRSDDGTTLIELNASSKEVRIVATGGITLDGPVNITGAVTTESTITAQGDVKSGNISLTNHEHPVTEAPGTTGTPQ